MPSESDQRLARLQAEHLPEAIASRIAVGPDNSYLRDGVLGAIDGCVTTFAVVAGVAGASLSSNIVIVLGLANLLADGFSMAASNYQGIRAERQVRERERRIEEYHIDTVPEGEREELRQIFAAKGLSGEALEQVVNILTSDRRIWVETMLELEKGLPSTGPSPIRAGLITFATFVAVGLVPLSVYLYDLLLPGEISNPFLWSAILTGVAFFAVGAVKSRFILGSWYAAGLETFAAGGAAAALAFMVGRLLKQVAGIDV